MKVDLEGLRANILAAIPLRFKQERHDVAMLIAEVERLEELLGDRTIQLQQFVGWAQRGVSPNLDSVNAARESMGMHHLDDLG